MTNVAINGLGRTGRMLLRRYLAEEPKGITIVALNDLMPIETLVYLLKFDSVHGKLPYAIGVQDGQLKIGDRLIKVLCEKDPAQMPWKALGVHVVIDSTGLFTKRELAAQHIEAGARRVLISAPSKSADVSIVLGVNNGQFEADQHQVVSMASYTTNSLAPVLKVLNDAFGLESAMVTTVHAYTSSQGLVDRSAKKLRRGRAAATSLIPTSTGAAIATTWVLPELEGKLDAIAIRVPVPDGAITDISAHLREDVSAERINAALKEAAETSLRGILAYSEEELVSADILGDPHSGIIDGLSTRVLQGHSAKVLVWYDNEVGYAQRLLDAVSVLSL